MLEGSYWEHLFPIGLGSNISFPLLKASFCVMGHKEAFFAEHNQIKILPLYVRNVRRAQEHIGELHD